ncbi:MULTISPECIES: glutamine amidotransferase [unclassified Brenneria]|uniref:glutamine amidotransferase n=1 Tax=unclassified Brenneria TaxID=2634434 RepID=UPI0018F08106|nr:glutamine amidotransferase [Brenneria sp. L3-3C-1]MBJ7221330.1 glutamine amidotransferase [Brenneria sp. L3-3C-1]MEE3642574.1 glutamine amidotransferase [Brenneria sp. L3_3C_1]
MNKKRVLVIQMGEPPQGISLQVGQQGKWFSDALPDGTENLHVVRPDRGDALPPFDGVSAVIISGSWAMVTDRLEWSEYTAGWLREAFYADMPMLGVCYGHQLLADALGGTVGNNPNGKEIGVQLVTVNDGAENDVWLQHHPRQFTAYLSHQQSVLVPPAGAQVLAGSQADRCQIIRYSDRVLTLQFHPEFNVAIMQACLRYNDAALRQAGYDVGRLMDIAQEPVWSRRILLDFVQRYGAR